MVNPDIEYSEVEQSNKEIWLIAKEKISEIMGLIGKDYNV